MNRGWTRYMTRSTIVFMFALFISSYLMFGSKVYGIVWMLAALIIFILICNGNYFFQKVWENSSDKDFRNKLFWSSILIRLIAMFVLLAISYKTWNNFFYVGAKDEMVYYRIANEASNLLSLFGVREAYDHIYNFYKKDISDTGFSTFLLFPISIIGNSPVFIKMMLCVLGSVTVVRIYRLASLVLDKQPARLAAIFMMLYPISWFYSAVMLKEGLMVLLITEVLILTVRLQSHFKLNQLFFVIVLIIVLFLFRSAISILLIMVFGFSMFMQKKNTNLALNILVAVAALGIYFYFLTSTGEFDDYYDLYIGVDDYTDDRISQMKESNPLVVLVGSPVFTVVAVTGPFPTIIKTPLDMGLTHNEYYYHVAGNLFYLILAFFSIYGLYFAIRYRRQVMAPIWAFAIGYQFVLLKAMMFTSVRFAYPAKPFLLILAAYGIYNMKSKRWYPIYLVAALIMVLGWNYVKLKGKGID